MGTHINGPSYLISEEDNKQQIKLEEFLAKKNPDQKELPFLFKVLSIEDPLSIQAHPNKKFAEYLHEKSPNIYKDPNHKPEMAIAISDKFYMLYGFLSVKNVKILCDFLLQNKIFEAEKGEFNDFISLLHNFISEKDEKTNFNLYKDLLIQLLKIPDEKNLNILTNFINYIKSAREKGMSNIEEFILEKLKLTETLYEKFGLDKGIIFSLFMNYFQTNYGEAIFIGANIPHAYIYGDCMECMANSDNVIRLGLTPKFIDKENFENIIINNFDELITDNYKFNGKKINEFQIEYVKEGISDFKLNYFKMQKGNQADFYNENNAILIVIKGQLKSTLKDGKKLIIQSLLPYFIEEKTNVSFQFEESGNSADNVLEFYIASY
jgi:mannose-6-phosphate isomerase